MERDGINFQLDLFEDDAASLSEGDATVLIEDLKYTSELIASDLAKYIFRLFDNPPVSSENLPDYLKEYFKNEAHLERLKSARARDIDSQFSSKLAFLIETEFKKAEFYDLSIFKIERALALLLADLGIPNVENENKTRIRFIDIPQDVPAEYLGMFEPDGDGSAEVEG